MEPTTPVQSPIASPTPSPYLSPAQVQSARSTVGISSGSGPSANAPTGQNLIASLKSNSLAAPDDTGEKPAGATASISYNPIDYIKGVVGNMQQEGKNVDTDIDGGVDTAKQGIDEVKEGQAIPGAEKVVKGEAQGVLRGTGDFIGGLFSPITQALKVANDQIRQTAPGVASEYDKVINKVADFISNDPDLQKFAVSHPNAGADFGRALNIGAVVTGGAEGEVDNIPEENNGVQTPEVSTFPEPQKQLNSRIADATPTFNENMIGQNVRTPDTIGEDGQVTKGTITPRIADEQDSVTGERPVTTSASENEQGAELNNIKDYPDKGTNLEKGLSVQKAIGDEAENMRGELQKEDEENPLDADTQKEKVTNLVKSNLPSEVQKALGVLSPEDQEFVNAMQRNAGLEIPEGGVAIKGETGVLPKTAANRYYQQISDAVGDYDGSREGLLDLRQKIDDVFQRQGGKYAHGTDTQNLLAETHADIRDGLNKELHDNTDNTDVQASLKKQTNLYRAMETLYEKAREEGNNAFQRFQKKYPITGTIKRMVLRKGIGQVL